MPVLRVSSPRASWLPSLWKDWDEDLAERPGGVGSPHWLRKSPGCIGVLGSGWVLLKWLWASEQRAPISGLLHVALAHPWQAGKA